MTFFIRTAGRADLPTISALLSETWHDTYDGIYGVDRVSEITKSWHSLKALEPRLGRPESEFVVADDGRRLGGMAFAASSDAQRKLVVLHQLYVHPSVQGQGIGTELLREIFEAFPDALTIRLEVEEANEKALNFYKSHGFVATGRTDNCGDRTSGIPALVMERPLG
ncbi:Ribosomal protein S18 acetylase RimI [Fulvimarina manganoxydans]|uniref:Ribosomal protein S18 acetylase RimI n=1 Tax=Fulvimarina manganoxydans TaxID=937218 RepID=A0A1W1ZYA5_9HYPH|nr:GNAT family N-acetyltransferase [Fulvimarina manganoxydans]SMC53479.1 Ribosomal protein S18 acetylase RimI [Fulvimarina manganoxydans]